MSITRTIAGKVIWTRSNADWDEDRLLFGKDEAQVLRLPCIEISRIPAPIYTGLLGVDEAAAPPYFAVTSSNAARFALTDKRLLAALKSARDVFTHGKATAEILRSSGITPKVVEVKTAKELGDYLKGSLPRGSSLIWPCGEEVAFDFSADLNAGGIIVHRIILYVTNECVTDSSGKPLDEQARQKFIDTQTGVICFASPSAARVFSQAFKPKANRLFKALGALSIGPTTASAVAGNFQKSEVCSDSSLLELASHASRIR